MKRIVCLANSRKLSGRCVAGKELIEDTPAGWIRPVSDRPHQEVSEYERNYQDGTDPRVLDIVDIPLKSHQPAGYQSENWLLDPDHYWTRMGSVSWNDLYELCDKPNILWINGFSTGQGSNDRIPIADAGHLTNSLFLLHLDKLTLRVFAPGADFGNHKRRVQAEFSYSGAFYALWVTDPKVETAYLAREDGRYSLGECFVTVSLGEPHDDGYCYKLVATILTQTSD